MKKIVKTDIKEIGKKHTKFLSEFRDFALKGNVIDLAVGVIIGAAFKTIVDSLVGDIISPVLGLFGKTDFTSFKWVIKTAEDGSEVAIKYGSFITAIINFVIMAFIIFLFVKAISNLRKLTTRKEDDEPTTKKCPFCKSEIDIEATRCPHCTSELPPDDDETE